MPPSYILTPPRRLLPGQGDVSLWLTQLRRYASIPLVLPA